MAHLEVRKFIRATQQEVWDVMSDIPAQKDWMVDVRRFDVLGEQQSGVGVLVDMQTELFGLPLLHDLMEITEWDPPWRLAILHKGQFSGTGYFELQPESDGTVFVWVEDFEPPLGLLGELGFQLAVKGHLRHVFGKSLNNLKWLIEGANQKKRQS